MENIREKLMELLMQAYDAWYAEEPSTDDEWDYFTDYLIAHGVTIERADWWEGEAYEPKKGE